MDRQEESHAYRSSYMRTRCLSCARFNKISFSFGEREFFYEKNFESILYPAPAQGVTYFLGDCGNGSALCVIQIRKKSSEPSRDGFQREMGAASAIRTTLSCAPLVGRREGLPFRLRLQSYPRLLRFLLRKTGKRTSPLNHFGFSQA